MDTRRQLLGEVEQAVATSDDTGRQTMLGRLADLFVGFSQQIDDEKVEVFDLVIHRLADCVGTDARALLSDRFADLPNAPPTVLRSLAFDQELVVAGPVLTRASRLDEDDLVILAKERGQAHLSALARRRTLSERVTDVLVERGDRDVVHAMAANAGARLSDHGLASLAGRSKTDETLVAVMARRQDRPAAQAALSQANARTSPASEPPKASPRPAPQVDERQITAWLARGRVADALAGLAQVAGIPTEQAVHAYEASEYEPLLYLVRAVRFSWTTFKLFLQSKQGTPPSPEFVRGAVESFRAMSVTTAVRILADRRRENS